MAVLDLIVTHYNEPKEVYSKFFQMLMLQRGVDFKDIRVIAVNDGEENRMKIPQMPCDVEQYSIPKCGISAVRNFGIEKAKGEWISFCDCDDCFSTVYSLKMVIEVLKDKSRSGNLDMVWTHFCSEDSDGKGGIKLIPRDQVNLVFIHGKYYRRQFIVDNGILFPEDLEFNEDSAFNAVANTIWDYKRTAEIKTTFPLYSWCWRPGSLTGTLKNRDKAVLGSYQRNKIVVAEFKKRMPYDRYCAMVARMVFDTYYDLNVVDLTPTRAEILEDFKAWYKEHKTDFWN